MLSRALRFEADGAISGYRHPNEARWRLEAGALHLLNLQGQSSCVLIFAGRRDGLVSLAGPFIDPSQPELATGATHILDEKPASHRRAAASFDLFDTLVARRCFDPLEIFRAVEANSGVKDFARLRHAVEMAMFGRRLYGLDDVYAQLAAATGWSETTIQKLKIMELAEEWDNLFPIGEIVALVEPRDLIVSDMYLPQAFVRRIVEEKCGLVGRAIHLSNYGKHLGVIWPLLLADTEIVRHYGDNPHADIASPKRFGVEAQHVTVSQWSPGERILLDLGLRPYAQAVREARLRAYDADPIRQGVAAVQLRLNLPLLIIGGLYCLARARAIEADTLLMCSRDCNLLAPLVERIAQRAPHAPRVRYIRASRKLFLSGSVEYEAYFQRQMGARNCLIDLVGTGQSPAHFLRATGLGERVTPLLLVGEPQIDAFDGVRVESLTKHAFIPVRLALEALNMSLDGTAMAGRFADYALEIVTAPCEFSAGAQSLIAAMRAAFLGAVEIIGETVQSPTPNSLSVETLRAAADAVLELTPIHFDAIRPVVDEVLLNLQ